MEREFFSLDYTFFLNLAFLALSGLLVYHGFFRHSDLDYHKEMAPKSETMERILRWIAYLCYSWLLIGTVLWLAG
jgi:succinate dehydrogenase/fumarate reductase cytochrome b subunit